MVGYQTHTQVSVNSCDAQRSFHRSTRLTPPSCRGPVATFTVYAIMLCALGARPGLALGKQFQRSGQFEQLAVQSLLRRARSEFLLMAGLESLLARVDRRMALERAIQETERKERAL